MSSSSAQQIRLRTSPTKVEDLLLQFIMSLKAEIEIWVKALEAFEKKDYSEAILHFSKIADSSRIMFNVGMVHAAMGDHNAAIAAYRQAQALDPYFAVSFFQCGVSHFYLQQYRQAVDCFQDAYHHLRENKTIEYEQIGLTFTLYSCETLYNQGLSYLNWNQTEQGMYLLGLASRELQSREHDVINEAIANYGRGYTVFSVPSGMLFRPSEIKVRNLKAKNYLGVAKLVASTARGDAFVGFSGTGIQDPVNNVKDTTEPVGPADKKKGLSPPALGATPPAFLPATVDSTPGDIRPLKLVRKKSSVDLRGGQATSLPTRTNLPYTTSGVELSSIDTNAPRPTTAHRTHRSHSSPNARYVPTIGAPMPPTPPDSAKGLRSSPSFDQRSTADTTLGYLDSLASQDSAYMEDLVGGYSAMEIDTPTRRPSLPASNGLARGQAQERVEKWTHNQSEVSRNDPITRYRNASVPPSVASSAIMTRQASQRFPVPPQAPSNMSNGFQSLRRGALKDFRAVSSRKNSVDEFSSPYPMDMISFRVKLHFQDDVRGMSLDVETTYAEFYTRLQSKFGLANLNLRYKDEDGTLITIADEDDWNSAIDAARENCHAGRHDGKLDIWIAEAR